MKIKISRKVQNFLLIYSAVFLLFSFWILIISRASWLHLGFPEEDIFYYISINLPSIMLIIFVIFIFSIIFYQMAKKYTLKTALKIFLFLIVMGLNIHFYNVAAQVEHDLAYSWSDGPELSSMYSTLVYIKAISKIILLDGLVVIGILLAKYK